MTVGFIRRPTYADQIAAIRRRQIGGSSSSFNYPVFKGKRRRQTSRIGRGAVRRRGKKKRIKGKGAIIAAIARRIIPFLKSIPNWFRSKAARKIATSLASSGVSAGVNIAADKLSQPGVPIKKLAKVRTAEQAIKLLNKAKTGIVGPDSTTTTTTSTSGSGRRKRGRRSKKRRVKRLGGGRGRRRRRGPKSVKRKSIKRRVTTRRRSVKKRRHKADVFDE